MPPPQHKQEFRPAFLLHFLRETRVFSVQRHEGEYELFSWALKIKVTLRYFSSWHKVSQIPVSSRSQLDAVSSFAYTHTHTHQPQKPGEKHFRHPCLLKPVMRVKGTAYTVCSIDLGITSHTAPHGCDHHQPGQGCRPPRTISRGMGWRTIMAASPSLKKHEIRKISEANQWLTHLLSFNSSSWRSQTRKFNHHSTSYHYHDCFAFCFLAA